MTTVSTTNAASPAVAVVILTMGDRPEALERALASVRSQSVEVDCLVVVNGPAAVNLPSWVRRLDLADNVGIPAGRNAGMAATAAPLVGFLDDDGELLGIDALERSRQLFTGAARLAVVSWRIVDEHGETARRHIPRIGRRGEAHSGLVGLFLGGACVIRREAFDDAGGYAGEFFYAMEEADLAWRLADRGWRCWYAADVQMRHPRTATTRHGLAVERSARNRAWAAHRNLPAPVAAAHLAVWAAAALRRGGRRGLRTYVSAVRGALRQPIGPRRPMRWSTVVALTKLGRPPIA